MAFFLKYLELILTAIGFVLCVLLALFLPEEMGGNRWKLLAMIAIGVSVIDGLIFFAVRHNQRKSRASAIKEVATMMNDRITNYLTVIRNYSGSRERDKREQAEAAIEEVTSIVANLSEESIQNWKVRYANLLKERNL